MAKWRHREIDTNQFQSEQMTEYGTCHKKLYHIRRFAVWVFRRSSAESSKNFRGITAGFPRSRQRIFVESSKSIRGIVKGYLRICLRASAVRIVKGVCWLVCSSRKGGTVVVVMYAQRVYAYVLRTYACELSLCAIFVHSRHVPRRRMKTLTEYGQICGQGRIILLKGETHSAEVVL